MLLGIAVLFEDLEYNSIRAYWDLDFGRFGLFHIFTATYRYSCTAVCGALQNCEWQCGINAKIVHIQHFALNLGSTCQNVIANLELSCILRFSCTLIRSEVKGAQTFT